MQDIEFDRRQLDRHKGTKIQFWLDDARLKKLDELAQLTGRTRTRILKDLLDGVSFSKLPDKSCQEAVAQLGRIGGLMKLNKIGSQDDVKRIFQVVKEMRRIIYGTDNS